MENDNKVIKLPAPDYIPDPRGLGYVFYWKMLEYKEKIAQIDALSGETETYGSLLKRCIRASINLRSRKITPDDLIMSCTLNHMDCCIPLIASLFVGTKICALDPTLSLNDMAHLLKEATPKIIFVMQDSVELIEMAVAQVGENIEIVVFGKTSKHTPFSDFTEKIDEENTFVPYEMPTLDETAIILFSSGTTGLPKGICITHHLFMCQIDNFMRLGYDFSTILVPTSLYWLTANMYLTINILLGTIRIVLRKHELITTLQTINKYKPTLIFLTTFQLLEIFNHGIPKKINVDSIKQIITGGVPVLPTQVRSIKSIFPKANFLTIYGQTEVIVVTGFKPEDEKFVLVNDRVSAGKPFPGFSYKVVDVETEETLGPNQNGELRLKTKYKLGGYYKRNSSEVWDNNNWYKTGDIVYYDENHHFYIVDRIKEMLKYQTWHVAPAAIKNILLTHPAVEKCLVIGIPHEIDGDHPMGVVVLKASHKSTTSEEIIKFVNDRVDDRKQLRGGVKIVDSFPVQPTGKIKKWQIRNMVLNGEL